MSDIHIMNYLREQFGLAQSRISEISEDVKGVKWRLLAMERKLDETCQGHTESLNQLSARLDQIQARLLAIERRDIETGRGMRLDQ